MSSDDGEGGHPAGGGRRTPEQERRAAERARRIRERRAAERARGGAAERARGGTAERAGGDAAERASGGAAERTGGGTAERAGGEAAERTRGGAAERVGGGGVERSGSGAAARSGGGAAERSGGGAAAVRERTAARSAQRARSRDPRYRRRRAVALLATVVVVLLGVSAAGWWALGRFGPGVASVEVTGARQIPVSDVEDAAAVEPGTPLAAVDTDGVTARVAAIPGVAAVEVGRSWPDTLTVAVTERTPVALADTPTGPQLVDPAGVAYRAAPPDARVPRLQLPRVAPDDPATLAAVAVLQALPPGVRDQVQTLSLGAGGTTFELGLTDDRRVLWGPWADTAATPQRAAVLGPLLSREGAVYDVSSPALVTVRPR
ncbi:FtsQ-type POTRA domain-containing protein [Pseudonocardia sp. C8]|uniref:cell division protein FtsQ/DivIB n=1 Tax=Pseudonocardia sp. C8 TaxID=2762759 RepID=UPI001642DD9F|nr:FtsQ-type POTRA domain-containing protein [Pseudonocardia sp. C8]MBC3191333.1 FtsQ-type POTRA domain-containing protein [Pseudonocardia sp. C8]